MNLVQKCCPRGSLGASLCTALTLISALLTKTAHAQCASNRPTDPDTEWTYGAAPVQSYVAAGGRFRIWYATAGEHAPEGVVDADATPEAVQLVARVAEDAARFYAELGFLPPATESSDTSCDEWADGLIDVYLFDFPGADGTVRFDDCNDIAQPTQCSGFVLIENDFEGTGYQDFEQAVETVLPHEYFHLVQAAYSRSLAAWWSEGTAQWAAKQLNPELQDLEAYLPAFFERVERPLDLPPATAAQPYSYGAAIFPVYLAEAYSSDIIAEVFEALRLGAANELAALSSVLGTRQSNLATAFSQFALWNAATGTRVMPGQGYSGAANYPEVLLKPVAATLPGTISGATAGLSATYYSIPEQGAWRVSVDADATRSAAWVVPFSQGRADLSRAVSALQMVQSEAVLVEGGAVVVIAGITAVKNDASYTVDVQSASAEGQAPPCAECDDEGTVSESADAGEVQARRSRSALKEEGGCSLSRVAPPQNAVSRARSAVVLPWGVAGLLLLVLLGRRRGQRVTA